MSGFVRFAEQFVVGYRTKEVQGEGQMTMHYKNDALTYKSMNSDRNGQNSRKQEQYLIETKN